MKKIKLTQGKFVFVDDCDYKYLNQWKWYTKKDRHTFYAVRNLRKSKHTSQTPVYMHGVILQRIGIKFQQVDHIDGNGLNNCRSNLRAATNQENSFNQRLAKNNTSGHRGIIWYKRYQKWMAEIRTNGRLKFLGYFDNIEEAIRAYDEAAIKYYGKYYG